MKKALLILSMLMLSACSRVDGFYIYKANEVCKFHKGVDYLKGTAYEYTYDVYCVDGYVERLRPKRKGN